MESSPYRSLEKKAFWRTGVANLDPIDISDLSVPSQKLTRTMKIGSGGSCFAQHISKYLKRWQFAYMDFEPAPSLLNQTRHASYGYALYSVRSGNIYTAAQLRQLVERATNRHSPQETVWETNGRYYDPFRPMIEPNGFASAEEVAHSVTSHLRMVVKMLRKLDVFIFTLGLTEAWRAIADHSVYPVCPGTQAGTFDATKHVFVNFTHSEILKDLTWTFNFVRRHLNPNLRFLLTVSPVPLTATASGQHVLTATTYSKSVLRAVAGELSQKFDYVDYFPSYELVTAPVFGGRFYEPNLRSVTPEGVDFVMTRFLQEFCDAGPLENQSPARAPQDAAPSQDELWCEEQLLENLQS